MLYFRPAQAFGKVAKDGLEVIEEESFPILLQLLESVLSPDLLHIGEEIDHLVGQRGLRDSTLSHSEDFDLPMEWGTFFLIEGADDVMSQGLVGVGVEPTARQRNQVGWVESGMFSIDRYKEFDRLTGI